jgi:hypothetical protein
MAGRPHDLGGEVVPRERGVGHLQRSQDLVGDKRFIGLTSRGGDDFPEGQVADVGVRRPGSRFETWCPLLGEQTRQPRPRFGSGFTGAVHPPDR